MESNYIRLIEKLKEYRIARFLTQDDIAKGSNLSLHTIVNLEKGKNVSSYALFSYINALGLTQEFINFPPFADMRFEDIPYKKYKRTRVRKKERTIKWGEDK